VPLALQPMQLVGLMISPSTTYAGQNVTGTVTLNGPALAGGATVTLTELEPSRGDRAGKYRNSPGFDD